MTDNVANQQTELTQITQSLNAMHIAQLTAYAFGLPPLYFCREYFHLDETEIIDNCCTRLNNLLTTQEISIPKLTHLLTDKEYFDAYEARLRVDPAPID